ncbi:protein FAM221B [Microcaecilia unicolor]|uniref:Protein FAM221B n=1 Tax=Microcaecilia unicolor TaxID=1415580 RepID=A0A6P7X5F5_9AMPH|nr:protein FAM221B [Microcaecilia unicolor]
MYGRQISLENTAILGDSPSPDSGTSTSAMDEERSEQNASPNEVDNTSLASSLVGHQASEASSPTLSVSQAIELQGSISSVQSKQKTVAKQKKKPSSKINTAYTIRTIVPAEKADVVSVARAMHREDFGHQLKGLFQSETDAALRAVQTGIYIGWRCPEYHWDCFRLGDQAKCFCGHLLGEHQKYTGRSRRVPCVVMRCGCQAFKFIPSCPEEVGEMWLKKRFNFDAAAWRAKCRCKHTHEEHQPTGQHACKVKGCRCVRFESAFLCAACDRKWEAHETFFETTDMRREANLPYGAAYLPFAEMPELRNVVLTGSEEDDTVFQSIGGGLPQPSTSH